ERLAANAVIANCDVGQLYHRLLAETRAGPRRAAQVDRLEASLSAHVRLVLAREAGGLPIAHHHGFFSGDYPREFAEPAPGAPADFAALFPDSRGALYGSASNGRMSAFLRPRNQAPDVENLFCVGGSTHPGCGVPMVALSARISCELLLKKLG